MLQNNPLLAQLKQQIHSSKPQVEGTVKATDKAYGFLECDKKSYFIPPQAMKKLLHGDKIKAVIEKQGEKEQAEPESLIEPSLSRFIAQVRFNQDNKLQLIVDHPNIKRAIGAGLSKNFKQELQQGDWVVANLKTHPLRDDRFFYAQISEFICSKDDEFAPWWVTLARYEQSRYPVADEENYQLLEQENRVDLTDLHFVTIDSEDTQDMDDALYIEEIHQNERHIGWKLMVAIADPTAYIALDSEIEKNAKQRCFTHYLPGFNIPMLPRMLSDDLCSLKAHKTRPALVCAIEIDLTGKLISSPQFIQAYVQSQAKLAYKRVSDYLEQQENSWQPEDLQTSQQIQRLHQFTLARIEWRKAHSLLFKEKADYRFVLAENGKVKEIKAEYRRIANQIVEEAMILANICGAQFLESQAHCGIFNTHIGFDKKYLENAHQFLLAKLGNNENQVKLEQRYSVENLATLAGYCQMRRDIEKTESNYLDLRLRRWLTFAEFKASLAPHFGLGLTGYATWTSPIRKYSDMVNHRLIKAALTNQNCIKPSADLLAHLQLTRRQNRLVERDIGDWLYCRYLADKVAEKVEFEGEICDIMRSGLNVRLLENGALLFVPISSIYPNREEILVNNDEIALYILGECRYKLGDQIKICIAEINQQTRSIIGEIIF